MLHKLIVFLIAKISEYSSAMKTHCMSGTKEYGIWKSMRQRCLDKNAGHFARYGGRGIKICKRWDSFAVFLKDMGACPEGYSIERKNNQGNYTPSNCIWTSTQRQANNRRSSRFITYNGKTQTLADWSRELDMRIITLFMRLKRGWSIEQAFFKKLRQRPKTKGE